MSRMQQPKISGSIVFFEISSNRILRTMSDGTNFLSRLGRTAHFLMSSALCLTFFLTILGKSNAMFRSRLVESTSNKFANLTTTVGPIPVMSFVQWCISA